MSHSSPTYHAASRAVAIQQPEHAPWTGFFNKMANCDLFVFLDQVQFKKRYFENRNRILTPNGPNWLTVPVKSKGQYTQAINQVRIQNDLPWKRKYLEVLRHNYGKHPYWPDLKGMVSQVLSEDWDFLVDLNLAIINRVKEYLGIGTTTARASDLDLGDAQGSDLILAICQQTSASLYLSGPDGSSYLEADQFGESGIELRFHNYQHPVYEQRGEEFASHMSVYDLLANLGPKAREVVLKGFHLPEA